MLVAEAAAYYKKQGKTLFQVLENLSEKYAAYAEDEPNLVLKGIEGAERISRMMESVRRNLPKAATVPATAVQENPDGSWDSVAGYKVVKVIDYKDGYEDIPASNVLKVTMDDGCWFAMRPSGTEPKIKFYYYAVSSDKETSAEQGAQMRDAVNARIDTIA